MNFLPEYDDDDIVSYQRKSRNKKFDSAPFNFVSKKNYSHSEISLVTISIRWKHILDKRDKSVSNRWNSTTCFQKKTKKKKKLKRIQTDRLALSPRSTKRLEQVEKLADRNGRRNG